MMESTGSMKHPLFKQFLRKPFRVGAFCSSSPRLSRSITSGIGLERAASVIELGPGAGAITREIIDRIPAQARFMAIELEKMLYEELKRRFPGVDFRNDSAANLAGILAAEQLSPAEVIVSGLPWTNFPEKLQDRILENVLAALAPGGCFTTFAYLQSKYLPSGRRFRAKLYEHFAEVQVSPLIWRNLPPAFIYRCHTGGSE